MDIKELVYSETDTKGQFQFVEEDKVKGEISFSKVGTNLFIIDHTFVDPDLRGTGAGKTLVERMVQFAREKEVKMIPLCPFANAIIKKTPEFQDVVND